MAPRFEIVFAPATARRRESSPSSGRLATSRVTTLTGMPRRAR
jgi:hypothetical protein